ncbi:MAG: RnfABCDGE type electron transport complex subunit G [Kiritimatiellia bacterium]
MKETIKLVAILTAVCAVSAAMLAAVYNVTMGPIHRAIEIKIAEAASAVMPEYAPKAVKETVGGETFFISRGADGKVTAVAAEGVSPNGYGGEIRLMVGLSTDRKVINYSVIASKETAGLGTQIAEPEFKDQLKGQPFSANWKVSKDGGDFDAVTSATISSKAAMECIRDAISRYKKAAENF